MNLIKLVLASLLLICLFDMPYGYYQLVRTISMVVFGVLAYQAYESEKSTEMIIYLGLAVLFQPIFKIALGRSLWNIMDVVVAIGLIYTVLKERDKVK